LGVIRSKNLRSDNRNPQVSISPTQCNDILDAQDMDTGDTANVVSRSNTHTARFLNINNHINQLGPIYQPHN